MKISQSILKEYDAYKVGKACGLQFEAKYIDGVEFPPSEAMLVGIFFEYLCTGMPPKSGFVPEPEYLKSGANKGELKAKWKIAEEQSIRFKMAMEHYRFDIKRVGVQLTTEDQLYSGLLDIEAWDRREKVEENGRMVPNPDFNKEVIIDLKHSGLLDNKYEDMGWELESLPKKEKLMVQPIHYKWLYHQIYGRYPTFYFFVHSSANDIESRIIKVNVNPDEYALHEQRMKITRKEIELEKTIGFRAYPEVKRCLECPLHSKCVKAITVPLIDEINYPIE